MRWKVCAFLVSMLALLGTLFFVAADAPGRGASRASYRRPAEIPYPDDNPYSAAKVELGRKLFFDPILSGARSRSCGTCHNPSRAWGDGLPRAIGEGQATLALRSPTLLAIAWIPRLGWDGKFRDLESVAFGPITSPTNMNSSEATVLERLHAVPDYISAFAAAFGSADITRRNVELALATFERSIVGEQTPFDRWVEGDETAIGQSAKRGFDIFNGKARCSGCHNGFAFSDGSFHDIGTAKAPTSGAAGFSRPPSNCATHSRHPRCAMPHGARLTYTMGPFGRWKRLSISMIEAGSSDRAGRCSFSRWGLTELKSQILSPSLIH